MRRFLLRLLDGVPATAAAGHAEPDLASSDDFAALTDLVQKTSRAQARISLKLEDIESKLEAGFQEARMDRKALAQTANAPVDLTAVLDALDLLQEAARTAQGGGNDALAGGITGISLRLSSFIERAGLTRQGAAGEQPDGRLFRVVGTEAQADCSPGAITRVIRAAVTSGDRIVREGEVLVAPGEP